MQQHIRTPLCPYPYLFGGRRYGPNKKLELEFFNYNLGQCYPYYDIMEYHNKNKHDIPIYYKCNISHENDYYYSFGYNIGKIMMCNKCNKFDKYTNKELLVKWNDMLKSELKK